MRWIDMARSKVRVVPWLDSHRKKRDLQAESGPTDAARLVLLSRGLRGFCDGFVAVLLPSYMFALGFQELQVGLVSSATLIGSALATLAVGTLSHRFALRHMLLVAAGLMAATGLAFASLSALWPLVVVAFVGTLNPGGGDVSLFLPLEHSWLAGATQGDARTHVFARYTLIGALCAATGSLAAGIPSWLSLHAGVSTLVALRMMFVVYAVVGVVNWLLYRRLPRAHTAALATSKPLGPSRRIVRRLALLFSIDAFAGGLLVNSLLSLWLLQRFGLSAAQAGQFFFVAGLLSATSQLLAPVLARRVGLLNTMVFTHIPSSLFLIAAAFSPSLLPTVILLLLRSALSQMDVPTRSAFVMAVVTPPERVAAASFTAIPRSLAAALAPLMTGGLLGAGWLAAPLVVCGSLKITYDLALLAAFRKIRPED